MNWRISQRNNFDMKTMYKLSCLWLLCLASLSFSGCSSEPAIYPVTGKITIQGSSHPRLIVYLHPVKGPVTRFNMGVGETDASGQFSLASSAGSGVAAGAYRVSFACYKQSGGKSFDATSAKIGDGDKSSGKGQTPKQAKNIVPAPYDSSVHSPVEFIVKSEDNKFDYDISK